MQGASTHRFVGGMRWRGSNASWPLAELLLEQGDVHIRLQSGVLRHGLGRWFPTAVMPCGDLQEVRRIRGGVPMQATVAWRKESSLSMVGRCGDAQTEAGVTCCCTE